MTSVKSEEYANNVNEMRRAFNNKGFQESSLHLTKDTTISDRDAIDYMQHFLFSSVGRIKDSMQFNFRVLLFISIFLIIMMIIVLSFVIMDYNLTKNNLTAVPVVTQ